MRDVAHQPNGNDAPCHFILHIVLIAGRDLIKCSYIYNSHLPNYSKLHLFTLVSLTWNNSTFFIDDLHLL